jgi:hypothetical protein
MARVNTHLVVQEFCKLSDPIFEEIVLQDRHWVLRLGEEVGHGEGGGCLALVPLDVSAMGEGGIRRQVRYQMDGRL